MLLVYFKIYLHKNYAIFP